MVAGNLPPDGPAPAEGFSGSYPGGYPSTAPTISIARAPASGAHPLAVTFTPTPGGGTIDNWRWFFGDGTNLDGSGTPGVTIHTYPNAGTFVAYLVVQNAVGSVTSATVSTTVS